MSIYMMSSRFLRTARDALHDPATPYGKSCPLRIWARGRRGGGGASFRVAGVKGPIAACHQANHRKIRRSGGCATSFPPAPRGYASRDSRGHAEADLSGMRLAKSLDRLGEKPGEGQYAMGADRNPRVAVATIKEFTDKELMELEERGISPYHMARFLEALRNNVDSASLRRLFAQPEGEGPDRSDWYI